MPVFHTRMMRHVAWCVCAFASSACSKPHRPAPSRVEISGAGATFPYPLYRAWFARYGSRDSVRINYFAVGSREGLRLLESGDVDFAASDRIVTTPEKPAGACGRVIIPMVSGAIAIVYTLSGPDASHPLRLDAPALAKLFGGRITRWNAPELQALNPGVRLPATQVIIVHRGEGSGTSAAFREYLAVNGGWPLRSAAGGEESWPRGIAAEGNEGVAIEVKVRDGAIGYVAQAYARSNHLSVAQIRTTAGDFAFPWGMNAAYPIVTRTWLVIDPALLRAEHSAAVHDFVHWALNDGSAEAKALEYTPVPRDTAAHYDSVLQAIAPGTCTKVKT